jgi:GntR family transcriptional regulator, transcriptional repressor for pyruvate dehydrogenase complex
MNLRAIQPASPSDHVFAQLLKDIVRGGQAAGDLLPGEVQLSEAFGVGSEVVREALMRLAQLGLVRATPGGHTEVLDFRETAGLDLLGLVAHHGLPGDRLLLHWRSTLEMRAAIATDAARLCALRGEADVRLALPALTLQMLNTDDDQALYALEMRYWDTIVIGADNLAYRLAHNSMMKILTRAMARSTEEDAADDTLADNRDMIRAWSLREVRASQCHRALSAAIAEGDAEAAETETRTLMRKGLQVYEHFVQAWMKAHADLAPA